MAHEESETVEVPGGYQNIYGRNTKKAGRPLPPRFGFEKPRYPSLQEAIGAAIVRSASTPGHGGHTKPLSKATKYDAIYDKYMKDAHTYLDEVKRNKRYFTQQNVYAPRFSQGRDEGLGFRNPPPRHFLEQGTPEYQPHPFWKSLESVVNALKGKQVSQAPWGVHEPTLTASEAVQPALSKTADIFTDPRNAWIGLGPVAMAARPMGWGAEVLRRYKLLGGTPKTLNKTLRQRGTIPTLSRERIVDDYRMGSDIAAPPDNNIVNRNLPPWEASSGINLQEQSLWNAGEAYDSLQRARFMLRHLPISSGLTRTPQMESGTKGIAAYDAVSRQVARMLDSPEYKLRRPGYGPEQYHVDDTRFYRSYDAGTD